MGDVICDRCGEVCAPHEIAYGEVLCLPCVGQQEAEEELRG